MKRYIRSSVTTTEEIENKIQDELDTAGLSSSVSSLQVEPSSSVSCIATVRLSSKYHNKKVVQRIKYSNVDAGVDAVVNAVSNYTSGGFTIAEDDAYVVRVSVEGVPIGYLGESTGSRSSFCTCLYLDPRCKKVRRYDHAPSHTEIFRKPIYFEYPIRKDNSRQSPTLIWVDSKNDYEYSGHILLDKNEYTWDYTPVRLDSAKILNDPTTKLKSMK